MEPICRLFRTRFERRVLHPNSDELRARDIQKPGTPEMTAD
jgi:hypothetical protein